MILKLRGTVIPQYGHRLFAAISDGAGNGPTVEMSLEQAEELSAWLTEQLYGVRLIDANSAPKPE